MNTDKLLELERKWRRPGNHTDYPDDAHWVGYDAGRADCADELAAALRAEQAVGTARQSEGVVVVPREPTPEMLRVFMRNCEFDGEARQDYADLLAAAPGGEGEGCGCRTCRPLTVSDMRMIVCATCGNKRCPHANDHRNECTNSNEPGQPGSAYPATQPERDGRGNG